MITTRRVLPLEGLRVVSLEHSVAAPLCTRMLADLGASVIKIERPGSGDFGRRWDAAVKGLSSYFVWLNRNKRSITLNLKTNGGKEVLDKMLHNTDVFIQNLRPGEVEKLGFSPNTVCKKYPKLVYCSISGYGRQGPYSREKAYDLLIQGESGLVSLTGYEDAPAKVGVSISDISSGLYSTIAILSALQRRTRTRKGASIDMSMFDCMVDIVAGPALYYLYSGMPPRREGMRHNIIVPCGPFMAKDNRYVILAVENEEEWRRFCMDVLSHSELLSENQFSSNEMRLKNRRKLEPIIESIMVRKTTSEWLRRLRSAGIACGRVNDLRGLIKHPQLKYRHLIQDLLTENGLVANFVNPIRIKDVRLPMKRLPSLGQDTKDVLRELGYTSKQIETFVGAKVV